MSNLSLNDNYALFVNLAERDVEVRYGDVVEKIEYEGSHSSALKNLVYRFAVHGPDYGHAVMPCRQKHPGSN